MAGAIGQGRSMSGAASRGQASPARGRRALAAALCLALAACGGAPQVPRAPQAIGPSATSAPPSRAAPPATPAAPPTVLAALGVAQTLTLRLGETVSLGAPGASLTVDRVLEDSRCPANAQCLWQGRVVLTGSVTLGAETLPFTLGTLKGFEDAPASFAAGPYTLSIAAVDPYPATPEGLPDEAYVLTLAIE